MRKRYDFGFATDFKMIILYQSWIPYKITFTDSLRAWHASLQRSALV